MVRKLIAIIVGLAVALILVSMIQKLGHNLYPPPAELDPADQEFMRQYMASLPWGPLSFVLSSYVVATLVGGWIAAYIAKEASLAIAGIIGLMVLAGAIMAMVSVPHPAWFATAVVIGIILAVTIAAKLGSGRSAHGKIY